MNSSQTHPCCALILAGGSGTRFWPLSRQQRPKQLVPLMGDQSLLQGTVSRLSPLISPSAAFCCTTAALADQVVADLEEAASGSFDASEQVLAEPMGRNTAPAIAWSVDVIDQRFDGVDPVVVVLPSDHYVTEPEGFRRALGLAVEEARGSDRIVTLGVPPRWPETGYGYLELSAPVDELKVYDVQRFTEKPDGEHANQFVEGGRHLWNAGIFVFRASVFNRAIAEFQPKIAELVVELRDADQARSAELYAQMPSVSIDFGLMEHLSDIGAVPLECGWNDLGSWDALASVLEADSDGNLSRGDALAVDSQDNLLFADEGTIAVVGVKDLVVVRTGDSVLVVPRGQSQEVRKIVAALREGKRQDRL